MEHITYVTCVKLDYEFYTQNISDTSWDRSLDNFLVYASYIVIMIPGR